MMSQVLLTFQIFKKWRKIKFLSQKIYMFPSLELLFGWNISLWNCFEEFTKVTSKKSPSFHTFLKIFNKIIKIFVLSYNLSHFIRISKKIDENLAQICRVFCFYVVRSYTRNLYQFWYFVKDDVIGKNRNITFDLDVSFDLQFF